MDAYPLAYNLIIYDNEYEYHEYSVYMCIESDPLCRVVESQAGVRPVTGRPDSLGLSGRFNTDVLF